MIYFNYTEKSYINISEQALEIKKLGSHWEIDFTQKRTLKQLPGSNSKLMGESYNLSDHQVAIILDNVFFESNFAKGLIFNGRKCGTIHNFNMDTYPRRNYLKTFDGIVTWYIMECKEFISSITFKVTNEIRRLVSHNNQESTKPKT